MGSRQGHEKKTKLKNGYLNVSSRIRSSLDQPEAGEITVSWGMSGDGGFKFVAQRSSGCRQVPRINPSETVIDILMEETTRR